MNYLFVDLETTGLDFVQNQIIEVGMVITNHLFQPLDTLNVIVKSDDADWTNVLEVVQNMHKDNGLWQASLASSVTPAQAEQIFLKFINYSPWLGPQPVMCGNTVHFDREFLRVHMPELHDRFHYRNFDVSTLKQMLLAALPEWEFPPQTDVHRAVPDCLEAAVLAGEFQALFASLLQVEDSQPNLLRRLVRRAEQS